MQEEPDIPESWWTRSSDAKPYVFALLVATGLLLELALHLYLRMGLVYTQFFYLIIVIGGIWYEKKIILVALLLGGLQLLVSFLITGTMLFESVVSAGMLILVAVVVGTIVEQMDLYHERLRENNQVLKNSQRAFESANKKLNLLSSITRHDILNQLTVLIGYLEISKASPPGPGVNEFIDKELEAAQTIRRQIAFTKDYEEIGVHAPEWQNVSESIEPYIGKEQYRGIRFTRDVDYLELYADPMLEKIYGNLIDNSYRHGGHVTEIRFSFQTCPGRLALFYEDNGDGIPDNEKDRIFDRGFGKNTGLGMFLSREILGITGLSIKEDGTFGRGARFVISAPEGVYRLTGQAGDMLTSPQKTGNCDHSE
ncbi:MAG TPA: HAMP domain-containing sensor histidine kinase [Methanoregulaceae archaeon]|nr:HAMP domain-containing sensor histidine kinase [Methanoregulaceae archaeon]